MLTHTRTWGTRDERMSPNIQFCQRLFLSLFFASCSVNSGWAVERFGIFTSCSLNNVGSWEVFWFSSWIFYFLLSEQWMGSWEVFWFSAGIFTSCLVNSGWAVRRFSDSAVWFFGTRSAKFQVIWICKFADCEQKSERGIAELQIPFPEVVVSVTSWQILWLLMIYATDVHYWCSTVGCNP